MEEYVVGSTEMTLENRDFLRSISIDAEDGMAIFDSITSAFKFCFSMAIVAGERGNPAEGSDEMRSLAPRQFLPEDYLDVLLPISREEGLSLGQVATQFGDAGIKIFRDEVDKSSNVISDILNID